MDEEYGENNSLLQEIRGGLGSNKPLEVKSSQPVQKQSSIEDTKAEMSKILAELKQKMVEIDKITNELEEKRKELGINTQNNSPKKTERILQEIKVPSLEMLK